jgi:hypothetical protein
LIFLKILEIQFMKRLVFSFIYLFCVFSCLNAAETVHSPITVNGKPLEFFSEDKTEYRYYLPHGTVDIPKVAANTGTKISVTDEQKTVTVTMNDKTYKIIFEVLPKLDLFLCIGQSNMAGRGKMTAEDQKPLPNVYLFTPSGNWEPAANPLNKYSSVRKNLGMQQICPAYGFAKKIAETTGRPIGLVVNAKGGTSIEQWTKGNNADLYGKTILRAVEAGKWGVYKAVLWHQGEANAGRTETYPDQLKQLVSNLRQDLGDAQLFFAAGELGQWRNNTEKFNAMIDQIETFIDDSGVVTTEGLKPLNGDVKDPHFNRESQLQLGIRYANTVLKKVYGK